MENMEISSDHFPPAQEQNPMLMLEGGDGVTDGAEEGPSESPETELKETPPQDGPVEDYGIQEARIINSQRSFEGKAMALTGLLKKRIDHDLGIGDLSRAHEDIRNGRTLNKIKELVKKNKRKGGWGGFVKENFSDFISSRSIQNWMNVAKSPYCHRYAGMGLERLLKADRHAKKYGGNDPIAAFLKEEGIGPIPESGRVSMETKRQIDAAITKPRPEKPKESKVNQLAGQLLERLNKGLENAKFLAKVDDGKLEALEATIKNVRFELGKK